MLDAAREAVSFVDGSEREVLDQQRVLVLALIQSIQIVGEAASKVSPDARQSMPRIPWPQIVAGATASFTDISTSIWTAFGIL